MCLQVQGFMTTCILCQWERQTCQCKQNYCFRLLSGICFWNPFGTLLLHSLCAAGWIRSWVHLVFKDINNLELSATASFGVIGALGLFRLWFPKKKGTMVWHIAVEHVYPWVNLPKRLSVIDAWWGWEVSYLTATFFFLPDVFTMLISPRQRG